MTSAEAGVRVRKVAVPKEVESRRALDHVDYQDAFCASVPEAVSDSAEKWMREVFEGAPAPLRGAVSCGWRLFGAKLGPFPSPTHIVGWEIEENHPDWIRMNVVWALGLRAQLVLRTAPGSVVVSTAVEKRSLASRVVWPLLIPVHQPVLRAWLWRAARARTRRERGSVATRLFGQYVQVCSGLVKKLLKLLARIHGLVRSPHDFTTGANSEWIVRGGYGGDRRGHRGRSSGRRRHVAGDLHRVRDPAVRRRDRDHRPAVRPAGDDQRRSAGPVQRRGG
ncbi:MAG: hypothetical protein J2P26_06325 [Nocardiopsaceae bacterium]|nr:hypothetical protein [Nocardiopsaceae bacterium]